MGATAVSWPHASPTDYRIQREQWPELKKSCPFGQLPILEVDGKTVLAQSYAILRYAGSLAGLLPTDALEAAHVDEVLYLLTELDTLLAPSGKETDAEKKKALRQALAAGPLTAWFGSLTKLLETNGSGFIVGKQLSIADLATYCRLQSFVGGKVRCRSAPAGNLQRPDSSAPSCSTTTSRPTSWTATRC